jgi:hypothetical protein
MEEISNSYSIFMLTPLGRPRKIYEVNIKRYLRETEREIDM